jgi:hypothetical protein
MMGIPVNFQGVEPQAEPGSGPLPDGVYLVQVEDAGEKTSQKGTPGISLKLKVIAGEFEGRALFDDLWVTQAAMGYVLHRLQCMGVTVPPGEFMLQPAGLVSRRARVVVRQEPDTKGVMRARVKGWEHPGGAADDPFVAAPKVGGDEDIPF